MNLSQKCQLHCYERGRCNNSDNPNPEDALKNKINSEIHFEKKAKNHSKINDIIRRQCQFLNNYSFAIFDTILLR